MSDPIRIANCSGFFGDRLAAAREMVDGGPIDVLTGVGYARTFMTQMEQVLGTCLDRGIKVVSNAGGLDPQGLGAALTELAAELGLSARIAVITGDDLMPGLPALQAAGETFANLDTGESLEEVSITPLTANAYLGGAPITEALSAGADVVVTGRVTDAALVIGPAGITPKAPPVTRQPLMHLRAPWLPGT